MQVRREPWPNNFPTEQAITRDDNGLILTCDGQRSTIQKRRGNAILCISDLLTVHVSPASPSRAPQRMPHDWDCIVHSRTCLVLCPLLCYFAVLNVTVDGGGASASESLSGLSLHSLAANTCSREQVSTFQEPKIQDSTHCTQAPLSCPIYLAEHEFESGS